MLSEKKTRPANRPKEPTRTSSMRIGKICCIFYTRRHEVQVDKHRLTGIALIRIKTARIS